MAFKNDEIQYDLHFGAPVYYDITMALATSHINYVCSMHLESLSGLGKLLPWLQVISAPYDVHYCNMSKSSGTLNEVALT